MAFVPIAMAVASTVIAYQGAKQQAEASENAAKYSAAVAQNNATMAEQYARRAEQQGVVDEQTQRMRNSQIAGEQRARLGASGINIDSGSPLSLQSDMARAGETDAQTVRNNAAVQAYGYRVQGTSFNAQSQLDSMTGVNARRAGNISALSSIVGGASSVSDKWTKLYGAGVV